MLCPNPIFPISLWYLWYNFAQHSDFQQICPIIVEPTVPSLDCLPLGSLSGEKKVIVFKQLSVTCSPTHSQLITLIHKPRMRTSQVCQGWQKIFLKVHLEHQIAQAKKSVFLLVGVLHLHPPPTLTTYEWETTVLCWEGEGIDGRRLQKLW